MMTLDREAKIASVHSVLSKNNPNSYVRNMTRILDRLEISTKIKTSAGYPEMLRVNLNEICWINRKDASEEALRFIQAKALILMSVYGDHELIDPDCRKETGLIDILTLDFLIPRQKFYDLKLKGEDLDNVELAKKFGVSLINLLRYRNYHAV